MTRARTLLTIETGCDLAHSMVEYASFALFVGMVCVGWWLT